METRGSLKSIEMAYPSRNAVVSFEITAKPEDCEKYFDTDLKVVFEKYRDNRSLRANRYFHKLCDLIRQHKEVTRSFAWVKNDLITTYGQIWYLPNGEPWIYKTNASLEIVMELEEHHMKFIREDPNDSKVFWYRVYRGSHTYDSLEMSKLIDGTIQEAKALGIETLPPQEIKRMLEMWEREHDAKRTDT